MHSMVHALLRQPAARQPAADASIVRVVSLTGFGRRDAADGAVVDQAGIHGEILGGILDDPIRQAHAAGGRQLVSGRITDPDADAAGLLCGGTARLLLTPLDEVPELFRASVESATPVALVTQIGADGTIGDTVVVTRAAADGTIADDASTSAAVDAARELLATGKSDTQVVEHCGDELAIATLVPLPSGHVVGSGPIAEAIMAQGQLMGWTMTSDETVDAGGAFLTIAGPADAIVILSHDPRIDTPLLDAALRSDVGYVGAMGSRHTQAKRRSRLEALGHDETSLARIHGPVGLDLGSRTPAETAVAIAAEYLANRSGRVAQSLGTTTGPING